MDPTVRIAVTVGWLLAAIAFLRWWELTMRLEGVLVWTAVFIALYVGALQILSRTGVLAGDPPGSAVYVWVGILILGSVIPVLFPRVAVGDLELPTVAFLRLLDGIVPLWILLRGVYTAWTGLTGAMVTATVPLYLLAVLWFLAVRMPGQTHTGPLPPLDQAEREIRDRIEADVRVLASEIGPRGSLHYEAANRAVEHLVSALEGFGYQPELLPFQVGDRGYRNVQATRIGESRPSEIVVVGAHYDTYDFTPGADDNASGVAAVLEVARQLADANPARTLRFVFFATEEPPFFNTEAMGSRVYARRMREEGQDIVAMLALETLGFYAPEPGTQRYPPPFSLFYPDRGAFVGFVGNPASGSLLRHALAVFRRETPFPSEGAVVPSLVPGVELSDHASFWRNGFEAIMITDTAPFRNPHYHRPTDTPETLDFDRMARVVRGIGGVVADLAGVDPDPS